MWLLMLLEKLFVTVSYPQLYPHSTGGNPTVARLTVFLATVRFKLAGDTTVAAVNIEQFACFRVRVFVEQAFYEQSECCAALTQRFLLPLSARGGVVALQDQPGAR
jgi:hypothetical protein